MTPIPTLHTHGNDMQVGTTLIAGDRRSCGLLRICAQIALVLLAITLTACFEGPGQKSEQRAFAQVDAAGRLVATGTAAITATGPDYVVRGELFPDARRAHLKIEGGEYPFDEVVAVGDEVRVHDAMGWRDLRDSDPSLVGARIPVAHPYAFAAALRGLSRAGEFGGVQVNGRDARRFDIRLALDGLRNSGDANAKLLARDWSKGIAEFISQVDLAPDGRLMRFQYSTDISSLELRATSAGGAFEAVSVDFTETKADAGSISLPPKKGT